MVLRAFSILALVGVAAKSNDGGEKSATTYTPNRCFSAASQVDTLEMHETQCAMVVLSASTKIDN